MIASRAKEERSEREEGGREREKKEQDEGRRKGMKN